MHRFGARRAPRASAFALDAYPSLPVDAQAMPATLPLFAAAAAGMASSSSSSEAQDSSVRARSEDGTPEGPLVHPSPATRSAAEDFRHAVAHSELPGIEPPPLDDELVDDELVDDQWDEWTDVPIECLGYTVPTRPGDRGYTMATMVALVELGRQGGAR